VYFGVIIQGTKRIADLLNSSQDTTISLNENLVPNFAFH